MSCTDSTQFSSVAPHYHNLPSLPEAKILENTMNRHLCKSDLYGKRVLDLACGTGRWSRYAVLRGASEVVGVDLSLAMIKAAEALSDTKDEREMIKYVNADCTKPLLGSLFEKPFDLAMAFCFLNYAQTEEEMLRMWDVIAGNLKLGAKLVALVPNLDLQDDFSRPIDARYGTSFRKIMDVNVGQGDYGFQTRFSAFTNTGTVEFDMYRLNRELYRRTAKKAGMSELQFYSMECPVEDALSGYWDEYMRRPHYEIMTSFRETEA